MGLTYTSLGGFGSINAKVEARQNAICFEMSLNEDDGQALEIIKRAVRTFERVTFVGNSKESLKAIVDVSDIDPTKKRAFLDHYTEKMLIAIRRGTERHTPAVVLPLASASSKQKSRYVNRSHF